MPWVEPFAPPTVANTNLSQTAPTPAGNVFSYYAYDLLTGRLLGSPPMRAVTFGQQLNNPGQAQFTLDPYDPRVQATNPIGCTHPNRTLIVVDYGGAIVWAGIVMTRRWKADASTSNTSGVLAIGCTELWSYFQQRIQATDYSSPPYSGIQPNGMTYWVYTPFDTALIATQIISDALGVPYGNPVGGMGLLVNGAAPSAMSPPSPAGDWVAVSYPFASLQSVDTIVTQLSQLGLGIGFDFGVDVAYSAGPGSTPVATINLAYPRRGRTVAQNNLMVDLTIARSYEFPEDGTQTANQVYELGGSGAIVVDQNAPSLAQGYPLWERVFSRANAQSQNIMGLLAQSALSDLALYAYPPVAPTITLPLFDPSSLGAFTIGDDIRTVIPKTAPDGGVYDPRFPAGLDDEWRIVQWTANVADEGDATIQLTLNQPPAIQLLAPAV